MREFPGIAFCRLGEGYGGHTTILAMFDRDTTMGTKRLIPDHLAFTIGIADDEPERDRIGSRVKGMARRVWMGRLAVAVLPGLRGQQRGTCVAGPEADLRMALRGALPRRASVMKSLRLNREPGWSSRFVNWPGIGRDLDLPWLGLWERTVCLSKER